MMDLKVNKVCDGCWKRGKCDSWIHSKDGTNVQACTCPCVPNGWMHTDNPMNPRYKR